MKARVVLAIVAGLALPGLREAPAEAAGPLSIGVAGGVSVPTGDAGDVLERGRHGQAFLSLGLPGLPLGVRGTVSYERFGLKAPGVDDAEAGPAPEGHGSVLSGQAAALLYFSPGRIRPYVSGGIGTFRVSSEVSRNGTETSRTETRFGVSAGAGVEMNLVLVRAFVEARLENIFTDRGFQTGDGGAGGSSVRIIPLTVGVAL